jgi:hypothetical protein
LRILRILGKNSIYANLLVRDSIFIEILALARKIMSILSIEIISENYSEHLGKISHALSEKIIHFMLFGIVENFHKKKENFFQEIKEALKSFNFLSNFQSTLSS